MTTHIPRGAIIAGVAVASVAVAGLALAATAGHDGGSSETDTDKPKPPKKPKPGTGSPGSHGPGTTPTATTPEAPEAPPADGNPGEGPVTAPTPNLGADIGTLAAQLIRSYDTVSPLDRKLTFAPVEQAMDGNEALRTEQGTMPSENELGTTVATNDTYSIYPLLVVADWADGTPDNSVSQGDIVSVLKQFDWRSSTGEQAPDGVLDSGERNAFDTVFREQLIRREVAKTDDPALPAIPAPENPTPRNDAGSVVSSA